MHTCIYSTDTKHMQKTKTSVENQRVPPPSSFHQHWPNQICNATMFHVYLMFKQAPKQWSEQEKARKETYRSDLSPLPWHTMDTDANTAMLHQQAPLSSLQKDARATIAHQGSSIAAAAASLSSTNLFPLEGEISNIGQPVGHPHREYNTIMTPKTCQYN